MGNIAQNADAYKDQVQARYDDKANALTQAQLGQSQMSEQGYSNMAAGGINMMGSALGGISGINQVTSLQVPKLSTSWTKLMEGISNERDKKGNSSSSSSGYSRYQS